MLRQSIQRSKMGPCLIRETADPDYVQSFVRGLDVIRAFSRYRPRMTLSEVADETHMTRAAARRFLLTLVKENYAQTDGKYFELRPKVLDLGFAYLASMTLVGHRRAGHAQCGRAPRRNPARWRCSTASRSSMSRASRPIA